MSSSNSVIEIKNHPSSEQLEQILDILGSGFSVGRAFFQERIQHDPTFTPANTWYATVDQVIASSVQIFPMRLRLGQDVLRVAGMGSVCTHTDYQGKGLATRILNSQSIWMRQKGYHLSMLLASKHSFYMRSGWNLLPEVMYKLNNLEYCNDHETSVSKLALHSAIDAATRDKLLQPVIDVDGYSITQFSPAHLKQMSQLYDAFNSNRTGSYVRDETYWTSLVEWPTWREAECLLLWQQDTLIAYGIIAHTRDDGAILREFIYNPHDEADIMPLFTALCKLRSDARYITAKLPYDHRLLQVFQKNGASSHLMNVAMWKILNCEALFADIQSQLQERLLSDDKLKQMSMQLNIKTEHDEISFILNQCRLHINVNTEDYDTSLNENGVTLTISEINLIKWLLYGYDSTDEKSVTGEIHEASQREAVETVLSTLFPEQPYAFYITDYY